MTPKIRLAALALTVSTGAIFLLPPSRQPLTAPLSATVEMKDMTWVEVRSAIADGHTAVIVPTGGIEQNGPHMILGKHDYIVAEAALRIAREAGRTLVAPVVSFVPEGGFDPPTGHMRFPGTIGLPEPVFAATLDAIARSLKLAGFKTIVFIGDHGQSQPVQRQVAEALTKAWTKDGVRVVQLDAYYNDQAQVSRLVAEGHSKAEIGLHAGLIDTSELMSVNARGVDLMSYVKALSASEPTGVSGDPRRADAERGRSLLDMRVKAAVAALRTLAGT